MASETGRPGVCSSQKNSPQGLSSRKTCRSSGVRMMSMVPVVQGEVIHKAQDFFFDVQRELVGPPVCKHADAVAAPIVSGAR